MIEQHVSLSAVGRHFDEEIEIAAMALQYFDEAGCPEGHHPEFWLRAEREFHEKHMARPVAMAAAGPTAKDEEILEEMLLGK
jgi:hypothetical protein